MLELIGVVASESGSLRLDRCSFAIRPGEVLGIVGPTGSGKTAALEIAAGLLGPARGRIVLEGRDVTRRPGRLRAAAALLRHEAPAPSDLVASDWLAMWAALDGVERGARTTRTRAALARFDLEAISSRRVDTLSAGERRRLQLARIWTREPPILLLDAPDQGLDGDGLRMLSAAVRERAAAGATIALTATGPYLPASLCDRALRMEGGAVVDELCRGDGDFGARIATAQGWAA